MASIIYVENGPVFRVLNLTALELLNRLEIYINIYVNVTIGCIQVTAVVSIHVYSQSSNGTCKKGKTSIV